MPFKTNYQRLDSSHIKYPYFERFKQVHAQFTVPLAYPSIASLEAVFILISSAFFRIPLSHLLKMRVKFLLFLVFLTFYFGH